MNTTNSNSFCWRIESLFIFPNSEALLPSPYPVIAVHFRLDHAVGESTCRTSGQNGSGHQDCRYAGRPVDTRSRCESLPCSGHTSKITNIVCQQEAWKNPGAHERALCPTAGELRRHDVGRRRYRLIECDVPQMKLYVPPARRRCTPSRYLACRLTNMLDLW